MVKNLLILCFISIILYKEVKAKNRITASILSLLLIWCILATFTNILNSLPFFIHVLSVVVLAICAIFAYTYESEKKD
ncbi:hypothetical protein [Bacillus cereus]|uniref:Uncharacterized protein n=1 Tax=Bacillus cereus VD184 TaxID=1053242 RepID=A0A9W5R1W0_BACCE|nr:hypothetical protein [Bacillus cereus]EOQ04470.1 hypothetical protein IKC_05972 [Bacillus cereus VD184]